MSLPLTKDTGHQPVWWTFRPGSELPGLEFMFFSWCFWVVSSLVTSPSFIRCLSLSLAATWKHLSEYLLAFAAFTHDRFPQSRYGCGSTSINTRFRRMNHIPAVMWRPIGLLFSFNPRPYWHIRDCLCCWHDPWILGYDQWHLTSIFRTVMRVETDIHLLGDIYIYITNNDGDTVGYNWDI